MKLIVTILLSCYWLFSQQVVAQSVSIDPFDIDHDILLAHYDCKTDVDDLHSVAAFATLLSQGPYKSMNYHAVAGAYGIQGGLYVPPNDLFNTAFGDRWSDAHSQRAQALQEVYQLCSMVLTDGGDVWIAEAGQSDFSADLVRLINAKHLEINSLDRIHIVQHSHWNQDVTNPIDLIYVQTHTDYHKIPDGNATSNGTPGFNAPTSIDWSEGLTNDETKIWEIAIRKGNQYNGVDGRYLNASIKAGGLDFSDFSEICWILGLDLFDGKAYFEFISSE